MANIVGLNLGRKIVWIDLLGGRVNRRSHSSRHTGQLLAQSLSQIRLIFLRLEGQMSESRAQNIEGKDGNERVPDEIWSAYNQAALTVTSPWNLCLHSHMFSA